MKDPGFSNILRECLVISGHFLVAVVSQVAMVPEMTHDSFFVHVILMSIGGGLTFNKQKIRMRCKRNLKFLDHNAKFTAALSRSYIEPCCLHDPFVLRQCELIYECNKTVLFFNTKHVYKYRNKDMSCDTSEGDYGRNESHETFTF